LALESSASTAAMDSTERFLNQLAVVREIAGDGWTVFFGSFGTGFVGVTKKECTPGQPPATEHSYIFLFVNVKWRQETPVASGSTILQYHDDTWNPAKKILKWSSQSRDKSSAMAEKIVRHLENGGSVTVAARPNAQGAYSILGRPTKMRIARRAECLIGVGQQALTMDDVGNKCPRVHKSIGLMCFPLPHKGKLRATRVTLEMMKKQLCLRCCWEPAQVDIHFDETLSDAFNVFTQRPKPSSVAKAEASGSDAKAVVKEGRGTPKKALEKKFAKAKPSAFSTPSAPRARKTTTKSAMALRMAKAEGASSSDGASGLPDTAWAPQLTRLRGMSRLARAKDGTILRSSSKSGRSLKRTHHLSINDGIEQGNFEDCFGDLDMMF